MSIIIIDRSPMTFITTEHMRAVAAPRPEQVSPKGEQVFLAESWLPQSRRLIASALALFCPLWSFNAFIERPLEF